MRKNAASRSLHELYRDDPDKADRLLFGRIAHPDRRGFLKGAGLAAMTALVGGTIPFHRTMPTHFIPVALADVPIIEGKDGLVVLNGPARSARRPRRTSSMTLSPRPRGTSSATTASRLRASMRPTGRSPSTAWSRPR